MNKIVKILPFYEERMWGGKTRLKEEFHYETDVEPLGEVYNVVALKDHADCYVEEYECTLSELYKNMPELFECECQELPIRVNILDPKEDLSIQIHPDDEFASKYNNGRGKPEAWVILDTPEDGYIEFGHNAKTREEFRLLSETNINKLIKYKKAIKDAYIDIPCGTMHAIGKDVLTYNISRNADCTLRLYDYDRIDPKYGKKRELQKEEVIANVNIPDTSTEFMVYPKSYELGINVTRYCDEPGLYTLNRLEVMNEGMYKHDYFAFYTCVNGEGTINDVHIRKGETVFVPAKSGLLKMKGNLDLFLASYRNKWEK